MRNRNYIFNSTMGTAPSNEAVEILKTIIREKQSIEISGDNVPAILVGRVQGLEIALEAMGYNSKATHTRELYLVAEAKEFYKEQEAERIANFEKRSAQGKEVWAERKAKAS